jgi:hypothetical protein
MRCWKAKVAGILNRGRALESSPPLHSPEGDASAHRKRRHSSAGDAIVRVGRRDSVLQLATPGAGLIELDGNGKALLAGFNDASRASERLLQIAAARQGIGGPTTTVCMLLCESRSWCLQCSLVGPR